ncbi:MAG: PH domain-containing protein [Euryarchaeota archaeon]|nr:PH domain-containing protein [Euryarchaeota archaeon]
MSDSENGSNDEGDEKLRKKLALREGEEILLVRRPSVFAFMPAYFVGLCVLLIHLFFGWAKAPQDAEWYVDAFYLFVEVSGWGGGAGFAFVMLFFTWLNRLINHPASGKWMTGILLLASLTPFLLHIDDVMRLVSDSTFEMPIEWDFTLFGIFWTAIIWGITFWYQRSFLYVVTDDRVIHHQSFIYERDGLEFLHEKIVAVMKRRTPIGAMFGYATVYCNIGDQSHIATETVGGSIGVSPDTSQTKGLSKWLGRFFFMMTYQRTIKSDRFTPDISFYGITKWEEAKELIARLMDENSAVTKAEEQLQVQKQMVELMSQAQGVPSSSDIPEPVGVEDTTDPASAEGSLDDLDADMDLN